MQITGINVTELELHIDPSVFALGDIGGTRDSSDYLKQCGIKNDVPIISFLYKNKYSVFVFITGDMNIFINKDVKGEIVSFGEEFKSNPVPLISDPKSYLEASMLEKATGENHLDGDFSHFIIDVVINGDLTNIGEYNVFDSVSAVLNRLPKIDWEVQYGQHTTIKIYKQRKTNGNY